MARTDAVTKEMETINRMAGQSKSGAFTEAFSKIAGIDVTDTNKDNRDHLVELVYAALVHGNGALRAERDLTSALELQKQLISLVLRFLPVGETEQEASERVSYWKDSFEGKQILPIALQELYFLLETSNRFGRSPELDQYRATVFHEIISYYENHPEDIWGDVFVVKENTLSYSQKRRMLSDRREARSRQDIQIAEAETEREHYVTGHTRRKDWLKRLRQIPVIAKIRLQAMLSHVDNDEAFAELYKKKKFQIERL